MNILTPKPKKLLLALASLLTGAFLFPASAQDLELAAYWDFNDPGDDLTAVDSAGDNDGEIDTATYTEDGEGRTGLAGDTAMDFSGGGTVRVDASAFFDPIGAEDKVTFTFWQLTQGTPNASSFWLLADGFDRAAQAHVPWSNGLTYFDTAGGCCAADSQRLQFTPADQEGLEDFDYLDGWHHYAFVKDGEIKQVYIDGILAFETEFGDPLPEEAYTDFFIGSAANGGNPAEAFIDDFAIYNGPITADQAAELAGGTKPPVIVNPMDTDGDGIRDSQEDDYAFLDKNDPADAAMDEDGDTLSNLVEITETGTNPAAADTDGDTINDNLEKNTGVWVSATDPGTSPKKADTDGDGLNDNVETNTGSDPLDASKFVSATDTGTSPHNKDTDGDGASDGLEVSGGTSPLDPSEVPSNIAGGGPWEVTHVWTEGDPEIGDASIAEEVLDDPGDATVLMVETDFIHFHDNANPPRFLDKSLPYPIFDEENGGDGPGDNNDYAIRAVGQIKVIAAGVMTFNCNSDDGFVLTIDGEIIGEAGNRGRADTIMTADLTAGVHNVEFIHWERGGGAGVSLEVYRGIGDDAPAPNEDDWELLTPIPKVDTDGDCIPDSVEDQHEFLDPTNAADGALDQDGDGLSNSYEYCGVPEDESRMWVRTDFTKKDTDEDGLDDNVETNTGTYVDATNTGTNPTSEDSDGDGLSDGAESNTGTFVDATNTGTNPTSEDSDGDGFKDKTEIDLDSDPTDIDDTPKGGLLAYWDFEDSADDSKAVDLVAGIEAINEGAAYSNEAKVGSSSMEFESGFLLVEDASFMDVAGAVDKATIVFWQKNTGIPNSSSFWFRSDSSDRAAQGHVPWSNGQVYFDTMGCCDAGSQRVNGDIGNDWEDEEWHHWAFVKDGESKSVWHDGEMVLDSEGATPFEADFTDLHIGSDGAGGGLASALIDEFGVFASALSEADIVGLAGGTSLAELGRLGGVGFQISSIGYSAAGSSATVSWPSKNGATYAVEYSDGLVDWIEATDGHPSGGESTNWTDVGIPAGTVVRYYRVRQE